MFVFSHDAKCVIGVSVLVARVFFILFLKLWEVHVSFEAGGYYYYFHLPLSAVCHPSPRALSESKTTTKKSVGHAAGSFM